MTPEMNRERAINLLNEFGLPLDEERITMIGDFLTIWIGWELRHVQQPATEPELRQWFQNIVNVSVDSEQGRIALAALDWLALRDVPQGQTPIEITEDFVERVEELCTYSRGGWDMEDPKVICDAVLKVARQVPVGPEGKK